MVFKPGKSGNPSGKPKGARNKTTVAMEKLLDDDAATITSKAIELAKNGTPVRPHFLQGSKASTLRPQCPLWVKSRHLQCKHHVRFPPESGHTATPIVIWLSI